MAKFSGSKRTGISTQQRRFSRLGSRNQLPERNTSRQGARSSRGRSQLNAYQQSRSASTAGASYVARQAQARAAARKKKVVLFVGIGVGVLAIAAVMAVFFIRGDDKLENFHFPAQPVSEADDMDDSNDLSESPLAVTNAPSEISADCNLTSNPAIETEVFFLVNQERTNHGLEALTRQSQLDAAATKHSADMACNEIFSHTGSDGSSPADRAVDQGYVYSYVGENIYTGTDSYNTAQQAVISWMNSDGHRANILNTNYMEMGVGYIYCNDNGAGYFTNNFGRP